MPYRVTEQALSMAAFTQRTEGLFSGSAWCPFQCIQAVKIALITHIECMVREFTNCDSKSDRTLEKHGMNIDLFHH